VQALFWTADGARVPAARNGSARGGRRNANAGARWYARLSPSPPRAPGWRDLGAAARGGGRVACCRESHLWLPTVLYKIASMESGNYAMVQVAEALAKSGVKLVPDVVAGGGSSGGGTLVDVLLANLIRDNAGAAARRP
jgi:hypothetical protein